MKTKTFSNRALNGFVFAKTTGRIMAGKLIAATMLLAGIHPQVQAQSSQQIQTNSAYALSNAWASGATTTSTRGLAYNAIANQVLVANTGGSIAVYDGTLGTSLGAVSFSGVTTSGTQPLNQIGVAADGVLYGGNLTTATASSNYRLYRWPAWNAPGQNVYTGDPTAGSMVDNGRIGDSLAVTGSGTNTLLVVGNEAKSTFVLFSTLDGTNFTPTVVTNLAISFGTGGLGLSFYTNNTFMVKPANSSTISLVQFPATFPGQAGVSGTIIASTTLPTPTSPASSASALLSYNPATALLGVAFLGSSGSGQSYYGQLYSFNFASGPVLLASTHYTAASNGNLTGGIALAGGSVVAGGGSLYLLNSANNVQALQIVTTSATFALSNAWASGSTTTSTRGVAYSAISNQVFVANTAGSIAVYDGSLGTSLGSVSFSGVTTSGTQPLNQIGVAADGVLYGGNLTTATATSNFRLYRWPAWNASGQNVYVGDPTAGSTVDNGRMGDSLTVTGSGTNTLIVVGNEAKSTFVLFSTPDGSNFTPTVVTNLSISFSTGGLGLAFYTNNTFMVKPANSSTISLVQFPATFPGQAGVSGTIIATTTLPTPASPSSSATALLAYNPATSLLGVAFLGSSGSGQSYYGQLYSFNFASSPALLASTNYPAASNGNLTGGVTFGGDYLYVLNSANSLQAFQVEVSAATIIPPIITVQPVGATAYPPYTLSVTASGTAPLAYQWLATNTAMSGSFTNIPGATNLNYTLASAPANFYEVIITNNAGSVTSTPVQMTILQPVVNAAVSSLWRVAEAQSGYSWLAGDNAERGIAYDPNSQRVVVSASTGLYVLNGINGANIEQLNLTDVSFGGLLGYCDQVGIADDGAVYAGNLNNAGGNFNLYRWSNPSNIVTATQAFSADPGAGAAGSERWGDTLAVRGAGPDTQILLGSRASAPGGTNVAFLTPNDGVGLTYSAQMIAVSGVPNGFAGYGISFGAGNTFWAKSEGGDLYEIAFDPNALTGTVIFDYAHPSQISSTLVGLGVDPVRNLLAGVQLNDTANDLQLFQLTGTADSPVLFDQAFFASANANGNENAIITVKYPCIYARDVNNGIVAVTYGTPATTAPTISTPPNSLAVYTTVPSVTLSVSASGSLPLYYQWRFNSNNISGATASTYTISNVLLSAAGYYDVVVHNIAGAITSTPPALLTLLVPVSSPQVTPLWSIAPGTNSSSTGPYLTTSGNETRGLAFDLTTSNLLVADHFYIHLYNGTNGQYLSDLNTAALPTGGINSWTVDQVGVADDGTLYSCNLSPDGTAFSIIAYGSYPYGSLSYAYGGAAGGSDLNTLDPLGDRWGDTMAVRGSGEDTQILLGSYHGTNVALFTTPDGVNFTPTLLAVQGGVPLGFASLGIAFGPNNTFYAKGGHNYNLRWVSFDTNADTGSLLQTYTAGTQVPNDLTGLGVDITNHILGGVCYNDAPHDVQLYLLSGNSNAPSLFEQDFFAATNPNTQENSVVTLKGGWGFGLDLNNGVVGFTYSLPSAPAVTITSVAYSPGKTILNWNNTFDAHTYQVQYKNQLLDATWTSLGSPVPATDATMSYPDTTATGETRFYRVISDWEESGVPPNE